MQRIVPSMALTGTFLATMLAAPVAASQEDVKRELEQLKLQSGSLSATPISVIPVAPSPPRSSVPGESAAITILAPLGLIGLSSSYGPIGTVIGVFAAPLTMGAGHFHAGDPARGAMVTLGGPAVMLTSMLGFGLLGQRIEDPSNHYSRGWTTGIIGSLVMSFGYWLWAANDAAETARRKQEEALRSTPAHR